ncbi:MAG: prepilin-type N-terminal cleavage/methylation domain-containing protein [Candidatus Sumerlaeia bacterium]|nr:prepilin-type N-terminal cleavage/methylation domain-containing protein [Candidatus Sumerlaeia bacterium]
MKHSDLFPARLRGFTLIELLIVVAIIAILAAIAVPNFLEAQVRSKVSRAKADMRSMATALEAYRVDNNSYPKCNNFALAGARVSPDERSTAAINEQRKVLERLSSPIAYITNAFVQDPFTPQFRTGTINSTDGSWPFPPPSTNSIAGDANAALFAFIKYATPQGVAGNTSTLADVENSTDVAKWYYILFSSGPDQVYPNLGGLLNTTTTPEAVANNYYDPTNGTTSLGDIYRIGGTPTGDATSGYRFFDTARRFPQ